MKTKVIFRKWPNGNIIALFPEEVENHKITLCNSYEHVGQHGLADPSYIISVTYPAKPEEYADLKKELENYGPEDAHYDLEVRQKYTRKMFETRVDAWREIYVSH